MKNFLAKYYLLAIALIVGFIFTIQIKANITPQGIVTIPKLLEMQNEIANIKVEEKKIRETTAELAAQEEAYKQSIKDTGSVFGSMQDKLIKTRNLADYETVQGPGIIITLNDSTRAAAEGQNIKLLVIHDIDILEIVNELRAAGAEAISINDERVAATSNIRCGGPTINIDGKRHAVPFIIKAVGDPKALESAELAPQGYIRLMEISGIKADVQKAEKITIPSYDGKPRLKYQQKSEGGETK